MSTETIHTATIEIDGKQYSILATEDLGQWMASVAELDRDGDIGRYICEEDTFLAEHGWQTTARKAMQLAASYVL